MARAGLGWSISTLAEKSGVSVRSINRFEKGEVVTTDTVETLRRALVDGGASFVDLSGKVGVAVKGTYV